jgi:hypothetical protein
MIEKWISDGIVGDKIIRHRGKLYELDTTCEAHSYSGLASAKKKAQKIAGKGGKALKIDNTYLYAVYIPYRGDKRPKNRK